MSLNGAKPSAFLQRFQNKISVVAKDGSHAKIGEPTTKTRPAPDIRDILDDQRPWRRKDSNMVSSKTMPRKENSHSVSYQTTDDISPEYGMKGLRFKTSKDGSSGRSVKELGDGYAKQDVNFLNPDDQLAYSRKARPVEYKPYSEKEYKAQYALGEYYELGKLGPDLDVNELNEKRQRQERIKAYAEAVRHENKNIIAMAPERRDKPKPPSKREKAIEFARKVPKPKLRPAQETSEERSEPDEEPVTELQLLALRHKRDKELVMAIKKDLGMKGLEEEA
uniref:Uncharacterized protein n=3 Tax=Guillardia theta TaxID=55529 RepID=A0A7S4NTG1_GUITH|mmetsp:Transcript_32999/g.104331  ORF Transcript_32999/g.104331 Transcript_32999/m.104331 type:complete len:279 (+) Transcript_32999:435-1271(+)